MKNKKCVCVCALYLAGQSVAVVDDRLAIIAIPAVKFLVKIKLLFSQKMLKTQQQQQQQQTTNNNQ